MSIWTSDTPRRVRVAACLAATVFLSACMGDAGGFGFLGGGEDRTKAVRELPLYRGAVVVRAPEGYCVDAVNVTRRPAATVVPLATCSSLTGEGYSPVEPALMTVSILPRREGAEQPSADDLAASLAPAEVTAVEDGDGVALVRVADGGQTRLPDGDPRYWRGAMEVNGHLVGLAVYGRRDSDLSGRSGRRLILDLAEALREASMKPARAQVASSETGDE
ncbi:hypothetical protein FDP25_06080 [Roseovarius sp. A21]|uniref:Uncharacterized protein n=1 Tax=Roseovarius bejariae TaxID=2576383 RepID=A0A844CY64_9RHOB|nr:hypothetical protein [Roseovarius bejariae]MRU14994.1 hypothetical protein [Roseovarius bejariae]